MTLNPTLGSTRSSTHSDSEPERRRFDHESILADYRVGYRSRQASLIGRREVLTGKAKFGIFGDGKEVAQLAMARAFRPGDFRSGYYRDQTFHLATGLTTVQKFFAQLYAHTDLEAEPASGGRQMTAHFATRSLQPDGSWRALTEQLNSSADLSPTASQMPRLVGLAYASRLYRELPELAERAGFSRQGNEIAFGTIGNASCAEGLFWEAVNAIGVLQAPAIVSIWDDGYGISVPNEYQVTKGNLSSILSGFGTEPGVEGGFQLFTVPGWDYLKLCEAYLDAADVARTRHIPAIIHVTEVTQPQGHSTSGSHERYKSPERLAWEKEFDCLVRMREWMIADGIVSADELERMEHQDRQEVTEEKLEAWRAFRKPIDEKLGQFVSLATEVADESDGADEIEAANAALLRRQNPGYREILASADDVLTLTLGSRGSARQRLSAWRSGLHEELSGRFATHLHCETPRSALAVAPIAPDYAEEPAQVRGFELLNACFREALARDPAVIALGEDVGKLGDVNQGFAGLQAEFGELRVSDTGIREATIVGQAIGMAMRGLRPIAEIQYLDYILYALQILSDDVATLRWRTVAGQMAPLLIRTRGHRLEGVWHSGSPMAGMLGLLRGMFLCVPRDMTQAAGMYNTLLAGDDPAVVVEVLNAYRLKEPMPENVGRMKIPLGVTETLRAGEDLTLVTYGACCRIALEAAEKLERLGIDVEVIDVQTLLPFDREGAIGQSIQRTNRVLFLDEDVPGGATAYMMQEVLERQKAFHWLDSEPRTLTAEPHRPAYGSDGDYFSKPSRDSVVRTVYAMMAEAEPARFPAIDG